MAYSGNCRETPVWLKVSFRLDIGYCFASPLAANRLIDMDINIQISTSLSPSETFRFFVLGKAGERINQTTDLQPKDRVPAQVLPFGSSRVSPGLSVLVR